MDQSNASILRGAKWTNQMRVFCAAQNGWLRFHLREPAQNPMKLFEGNNFMNNLHLNKSLHSAKNRTGTHRFSNGRLTINNDSVKMFRTV